MSAPAEEPCPGMTWPELLKHTQMERDNAVDERNALRAAQGERNEVVALLRRIVVRDGLNDNQWFWLHDCKELLARIDREAALTASPAAQKE